ncbi:MAG: DUF4399 domain-containing protein [Gammaproteobacteria bacterium]|nr:DUF4399 domain-containing protein [Gammaproteobacteria bacterium]
MLKNQLIASAIVATIFSANALAQDLSSPSPAGAEAYIISPANGATVPETFTVQFGLRGMGVSPAGIERENTGHHHLIVDGTVPEAGKPMGSEVKHFGGGQTETTITLPKGEHTLQLILGNHYHVPHNPPVVSEQITVTVK